MKIEIISLITLTLIHGKNLWYITDIYPITLFLFMLPIAIVAFLDYVLGIRIYNDLILMLLNILCIAIVGLYIFNNYYIHPTRYKTGGYGLLGDSTFYCNSHNFEKDTTVKYEMYPIRNIALAAKDSVDMRFHSLPEYVFHGVVASTYASSNKLIEKYLIYGFYSAKVSNLSPTLFLSSWSVNDNNSLHFINCDSFKMSDTIENKELAFLLKEGFKY